MITTAQHEGSNRDALIESLLAPSSYTHSVAGLIVLHETHISWVLLAGHFAYKIKKPIVTDFLDYGSLEKRHHACCEELRLGSRYAPGLYLDVVPVAFEDGLIRMDGDAQPIEFAVRMQRFDSDALLSQQLAKKLVTVENMIQLASTIATFHGDALRLESSKDYASVLLAQARQNFEFLLSEPVLRQDPCLQELEKWTTTYLENNRQHFMNRMRDGFIRECHGDLHCGNIVFWNRRWVPFDGIDFNSELSWIDVASDIAFLVMDLKELGYPELSAAFLNAYLEQTGDYELLSVLKWYLVYRALVRAKVAVMRTRQQNQVERLDLEQIGLAKTYIRLAQQLREVGARRLWITHGLSGSGKTTGSQQIVQREGAIRVRSDVERKRLFKTAQARKSEHSTGVGMYTPTASELTYQRLFDVSRVIVQSDYTAIVDATFLKHSDRSRFRSLANSERAEFRILDFEADVEVLQQRITDRRLTGNDASDATSQVLAGQIANQEPLTAEEQEASVSAVGLTRGMAGTGGGY